MKEEEKEGSKKRMSENGREEFKLHDVMLNGIYYIFFHLLKCYYAHPISKKGIC